MPNDLPEVRNIFSRRGAYGRFKTFLVRKKALDLWYRFEEQETERVLREWCEENEIAVTD